MSYQPPFINGGRLNASISGNTTGTAALMSTGTVYLAGGNNVTLSQNSNTISIAAAAGGGGSINVSGGTTSNNLSAITFSNSNNMSFGLNGSTMTGSHAINVSGGTTSNNLSAITFSNSNNVSFGLNGSTMTGSHAINVSGGTTSNNLSAINFSNANGVSFGLNASTMTGSVNPVVTMYAAGNTSVSSTGTANVSSINFYGAGGASVEVSAGNVMISAPSVAGALVTRSRSIYPGEKFLTAVSAFGNGSLSIQYMPVYAYLSGTRLDALVSWSASSSGAANTAAIAMTAIAGIYTRNASTLSSVSTGTTQTTYTYASNSANWSSINSIMLPVSVPVNINMTPGEYYVAFGFSTNSSSVGTATTNLAQTVSMYGANQLQSALNYAEWLAGTATSVNLFSGMGIFNATTAGLPATIGFASINQTGTNLSRANIAIVIRNY